MFAPLCILAIAISAILLSKLETIKAAEHWTSDWRTVWFSDRKDTQDESVALVLITEETLADSPVRIPIDRHLMAKVIRAVASAHPAAIGIDFVFARPTDSAADADLLSAIRDADVPIILGSVDERMGLPQKQLDYYRKFLAEAGRPTGHLYFERRNNLIGISDHVVREMPEDIGGQKSFAEVLAQFKRKDAEPHTRRIAWLLPPRDGSETFYELDARDLLGPPEDAEPLLEGLTGKVVLIGSDLNDMDRHFTPLSVVDETRLPGVKIHAQMVAQLIDDRWVREFYLPEELLMLLALGAAGYAMSRHKVLGNFTKLVASSGSIVLILAGFASFKLFGLILPYATALSAWVGSIGLSERIDKTYDQLASMWRFVRIEGIAMAKSVPLGIYAGLALLAGTALTVQPAQADVKILQSNVPDIRKGTVLKDEDILDVPENKTVKVLLLPSKVTKKIAGPYKGTAPDYAPSTMPTVQVKPSEQIDTGTTVSSPPPIDAPWLKEETPGQ